MNKELHKHADLIKAWAEGATIQVFVKRTSRKEGKWVDCGPVGTPLHPSWRNEGEYRIKPERVFPKTTLTFEALYGMYRDSKGLHDFANLIIRRHTLDLEGK